MLPSLNVCYVNLQLGNNTSPSEMYFNLKKQTIFFVAIAQNLVSFRQWMATSRVESLFISAIYGSIVEESISELENN